MGTQFHLNGVIPKGPIQFHRICLCSEEFFSQYRTRSLPTSGVACSAGRRAAGGPSPIFCRTKWGYLAHLVYARLRCATIPYEEGVRTKVLSHRQNDRRRRFSERYRRQNAQVLQAFFISGLDGRSGRGAGFSPNGRFFSKPLDCADSALFRKVFYFSDVRGRRRGGFRI